MEKRVPIYSHNIFEHVQEWFRWYQEADLTLPDDDMKIAKHFLEFLDTIIKESIERESNNERSK